MVNVLLVGNGAREHAIAKALERSKHQPKIVSYMSHKNPGVAILSSEVEIGKYDELERINAFAKAHNVEFAIIGPEGPLHKGVVDSLEKEKIPCVGPKKALAQLETSKAFTRLVLEKYNVPGNPRFKVFQSEEGLKEFIEDLGKPVIKPDGLTGGKGVRVWEDHFKTLDEAYAYAKEVLEDHPSVVVEEKLEGEEFSLISFTDGKKVVDCPAIQDHKRLGVDDTGPNTGGMGSYSDVDHSLPFLKEEHLKEAHMITEELAKALEKEIGEPYKGVMYGGFMATKNGVKVVEYNARLGDPEAMNILTLLKSDFVDLCRSIVNGTLDSYKIEFHRLASVCKYAVPKGYPSNPTKNEKIDLVDVPICDAEAFHASIEKREDGMYLLGSRAIAFVGTGSSISDAEVKAENAVCAVKGPVVHREDIGTASLIQKRIDHMNSL